MSLNGKIGLTRAAGMLAAACGGPSSTPPQTKPATPPSTAAAHPPATTAAVAVSDGDFGVKECDDYMKKYLACIDSKVPEAARSMVRQSLDTQKAQWKQAASTPEGRAAMANACKTATDTARQAMAAYGCQW